MSKRQRFARFELVAGHAPDSITSDEPGWRRHYQEIGCIDANDILYQCAKDNESRDASIVRIAVRCGIPTHVIVETLRKMAALIEREAEYVRSSHDAGYSMGDIHVAKNGELEIPESVKAAA